MGNDLTAWDFSGQDLTAAQFSLRVIDLYHFSDLTNVNFSRANLTNIEFSYCILTTANLRGANLINARLTNVTGLDTAFFDSDTRYSQWTLFPDDFDPVKQGLTLTIVPAGDFDADTFVDIADLDALMAVIPITDRGLTYAPQFDLNYDFVIDKQDVDLWVKDVKHTWFGDVNLDGQFNTNDLIQVFQAGQYEDTFPDNSTWSTGDWNTDGEFTTSDLVLAFQDGGYEAGPRGVAASVPEPACLLLLITGVVRMLQLRSVQ